MKTLLQLRKAKFFLTLLLSLLFILTATQQTYATHAAGSDIQFQCLGGLQYKINVTFYRDCGGVAEPSSITINYKSTNGSVNSNVTANKIASTGQEITVPCTGVTTTCNGGTGTGIRQFIYSATVTLPSAQTDWVFSYNVCCRNCAITTIANPCASNSVLYIEATLNNVLAPCDNSPTFSNIPIAFVCAGQNFNYNHGVLDPDGDSLAYQLITPKTSATGTVTFISPASATSPIATSTPFTLNATTGDLNFTPSQIQIGILALLVKEYRNGHLIGSVIRDMQIYTTACSNNLPTATGINGTSNFTTTVCPNTPVCFSVNTNDADAGQIVTVTTNNGIPGATYTIGSGPHPTLNFCWTPTVSDISLLPHTFTVTVKDNACPNNGVQTYSYSIYIPSPNFTVASTNANCNASSTGSATATPVYSGNNYIYNWSNGATTSTINNVPAGTYLITVTDISGCSVTQSTTITEPTGMTLTTVNTSPSCGNVSNGAIDLTVSGGIAPYTYLWSNGQTTQDISNVNAGSYTVTITDAHNCTKTNTVTLSNSYSISVSTSATNANCFGNNSGSITSTLTGGSSPFTYSWSNGSSSTNLTNIIAGTYTLTITDHNGCIANSNATVTQPAAPLTINLSKTNVNCFGNSTGTASVIASGGTTPYNYLWNNGATTASISTLAAATYTLTVSDGHGCTASGSVTVTQPVAALSVTSAKTNVKCFGNNTGAASVTASGGTTPYTYLWNNGNTTAALSNLIAGNYTATITDANNCTTTTTISITQPAAALNASAAATTVNCFGGNNASVTSTINGGTTAYSYLWNNGSTNQNLSNVIAGVYTITVTDANNCTSSATATVTQPGAALNVSSTSTNILCFGNSTGAIALTVTGGTTTYSYNWSNGATTSSLSNIAAGTYNVTVTDIRNCTSTASITLTQPGAALNITTTKTNVLCYGNATGAANVSASGGTSPYSYHWSNGSTNSTINNIISGTYTVTVTDANNCSAIGTVSILQPAAALSQTTSTTNVKCFGDHTGATSINVSGGTTPYTYQWNNGVGTSANTGIVSGNYSVTVTDANGCTISASTIVSQPAAGLSASVSASNVACYGQNTGALTSTVNGGTSPYIYSWSNGSTSASLASINSGSYTVTIADQNNCTTSAFGIVNQPAAPLTITTSSTNINCKGDNNGTANVTANDGTSPYIYNWSNGSTADNISSLSPGNYTVTVTDANNCSAMGTVSITQPATNISLSETHQDINCLGNGAGAIDLTATGGTPNYSFNWSNGSTTEDDAYLPAGVYTVIVTDANNCTATLTQTISQPAGVITVTSQVTNINCFGGNEGAINLTTTLGTPPYQFTWSNGSTTEDLSNLIAGAYTATITDANGCILANTYFVTQPIAPLSGTMQANDVLCFGDLSGDLILDANGGTSPYIYNWSNGATTQDLISVASGTYTASITDANGCTTSVSGTIQQPAQPLSSTAQVTSLNCHDVQNGAINISVSGGTTPYTYAWSTGQSIEDLSGLSVGDYTVTVTDANNCSITNSYSIIYNAATLSASAVITAVNCHGDATGAIDLSVNGGTTPYSYNWNNGSVTEDLTTTVAGQYAVTVTDANGCTTNYNGGISEPNAPLTATHTVSKSLCYGDSTGTIDLSPNGGTTPYSFTWSNGGKTEDLVGLPAGTYDINIIDANGCTYAESIKLDGPPAPLAITYQGTDPLCFGDNTGSITTNVNGGTPNYIIAWNTQSSQNNLTNLIAGTYTIQVTDSNGCLTNQTIVLNQPAAAISVQPTITNVDCNSNSTGSITLNSTGGTAPYVYVWSNNANADVNPGLTAGNYQYTITDSHQCTLQGNVDVAQPANALAVANQLTQVGCNGNSTGAIDLTLSGGTAPYSVNWNNGSTSEDLSSLVAGNYSVTIQDANGCGYTQTYLIAEPIATLTQQATIVNAGCTGQNTGSVTVTANGGTSPYIYSWSDGTSSSAINNSSAGNYTVLITDNNGCTSTGNYTITQPAGSLNATATTITSASCNGSTNGAIDITISGGTGPYIYTWSNGASTEDLSNLSAGNYTLSIVDVNQCTTQISVSIQQPSAPVGITYLVTDAKCFGDNSGAITAQISGGTAPYSYSWNNGSTSSSLTAMQAGQYSLTVTDANGCSLQMPVSISQPNAPVSAAMIPHNIACNGTNTGWIDLTVVGGMGNYNYQWNNGGTMEDPTNLPAGNYSCVITDQNGCTASGNATITAPANPVILNSSVNNVTCSGGNTGSITLNVSGGTPGYTYLWNNGSQASSLTAMPMGSYTVTVTDANGCTEQTTASISSASGITIASAVQNAGCNSNTGSITLTISGGTPNYTFAWNNGAQTSSLTNLQGGNYTVTVTDGNGCTEQTSITITEVNSNITSSTSTVAANCLSGQQGSININPAGGTAPYSYSWNNGATSQNVNNLLPGNYTVTITDANGCVYTQNASIADSSSLAIHSIEGTNICMGNTATITTDPISGATLQWQYNGVPLTGAITNTFVTPVGGTYQLVATTPCGVYTSNPVEIVVRSLNNVSINNNVIVCPGESVQLQAGGGVNYVWTPVVGLSNPNVANPMASPTESTTYTVNVKDSYGCTASASVFVAVMCDTLNIPNGFSPNGDGTNDFFVIKGLDNYPGTTIFIYNRWGNLVYKKQDYQNDWNGQSNVSGVLIGQDLPNGTYFYILDLKTDTKPLNGYVVIRR